MRSPWILLVLSPLVAGAQPRMDRAEAAQLFTAAGFPVATGKPLNRCGQPAKPKVSFVDMNGDRQPEAVFVDENLGCYPAPGRYFAVLRKQGGHWQAVIQGDGVVKALPQRSRGWMDLEVTRAGRVERQHFDGQHYRGGAAPAPAQAAAPAPPLATAAPVTNPAPGAEPLLKSEDEAALFKAAGFKKKGKQWRSGCEDPTPSYAPGKIEKLADLNGDNRTEALITEGGSYCYGNTGQGFWLLSQQADGQWKLLLQSTGMAEFLGTRGKDNYPDVSIGGPGFCFPVVRWNGSAYKPNRWEYEGKSCKQPV